MAELLLGIDVGTYSSKGVLVQPDGKVLKTHVVEHEMEIPHPGWAEQDGLRAAPGRTRHPGAHQADHGKRESAGEARGGQPRHVA